MDESRSLWLGCMTRLRYMGWLLPDQLGRQVLAGQRRQHAVRNARREHVRPLADCRLRNAYSFSGLAWRSAQQFNGFGLEHPPITAYFTHLVKHACACRR